MNPTTLTRDTWRQLVCEHPREDDIRLRYADWLDEQDNPGDAAHAELIRVQWELLTTEDCECRVTPERWYPEYVHVGSCRYCELVSRESELLRTIEPVLRRSAGVLAGQEFEERRPLAGRWAVPVTRWRMGMPDEVSCTLDWYTKNVNCPKCLGSGRGEESNGYTVQKCVECKGTGEVTNAVRLVREHPVTGVRLTGREPSDWTREDGGTDYVWTVRSDNQVPIPGDIPRCLFNLLEGGQRNIDNWAWRYPTAELAHAALSRAAVSWARKEAGLPSSGGSG